MTKTDVHVCNEDDDNDDDDNDEEDNDDYDGTK